MVKRVFTILLAVLLVSCSGSTKPAESDTSASSALDASPQFLSGTAGAARARLSDASTDAQNVQPSEALADTRMVTYSASLDLSVRSAFATKVALAERVKSDNGFIVGETERSVVARIPVENMDSFIKYAKNLGKVEKETKTGADITDQFRDNVTRLNSMKTVRDRYLALLEQAKTVSEVLSVERELERINMGIEMLEGRIKYAESSVAYSSVTVKFREPATPGPVGWVFVGLYRAIKWLFIWE